MVICLERCANLHMAQLMPLTVSCFSKIQIGFSFLVPAHPGSPGQRAVKRLLVYSFVLVHSMSGVVTCEVQYGADDESSVDSMPYHVTAPPSISVDPVVVGVYIRDTVSVQCRLQNSDLHQTTDFHWSKNERQLMLDNEGSFSQLLQHLSYSFSHSHLTLSLQ